MISRGAAMILYSMAFIALPLLISILIYLAVKGRGASLQIAILASLLAISGLMIFWKKNEIADMPLPLYSAVCVLVGSIGALGTLLYQRTVRAPLNLREKIFPHADNAGPGVLLVIVVLILLLAFGSSAWFSARVDGERYLKTGTLDQSTIAAWLNIRDTRVATMPIGQDIRHICGHFDNARLLGRSGDGSYVLFLSSRETSQVLRVPDDEYKVTPTPDGPPCQGSSREATTKTNSP
jgi:hypothetical protein